MVLVAFAWIFFRANTVGEAFLISKHILNLYHDQPFQWVVKNLADLSEFGIISTVLVVVMSLFMFTAEWFMNVHMSDLRTRPVLDYVFCTLVLILIIQLGIFHNNSFIYFQF